LGLVKIAEAHLADPVKRPRDRPADGNGGHCIRGSIVQAFCFTPIVAGNVSKTP
jgi:hypothetical protein